jgi:anionic cell wall polymer biosynthesis LytR-Cps2A-Psr (LCP) family protein
MFNIFYIKGFWRYFIIFIFPLILISFVSGCNTDRENQDVQISADSLNAKKIADSLKKQADFLKSASLSNDSNEHVIRISDPQGLDAPYQIDNVAGKTVKRIFNGRRINIAIIGVDTRLGATTKHADANHVLSILIDSGFIEMTAIPRDTPTDVGFEDSTGQNKLTILRAFKGRNEYLKTVAEIAGLDKIHYYVEFSFSQAIGILDWLGYKDPGSTLQVLRSRTGLGGDDYQRCYNQSQFIRQMILNHFPKFTGVLGKLLIKGALSLPETNLTSEKVEEIINKLQSKGFPRSPDVITVRVRPPIPRDYKIYDFSDQKVVDKLTHKIEYYNEDSFFNDSIIKIKFDVAARLRFALSKAAKDSTNPTRVIADLINFYNQRAWLQVRDSSARSDIRERFYKFLYNAYMKKKQYALAQGVKETIEAEKALFQHSLKKSFYDYNVNTTNKSIN